MKLLTAGVNHCLRKIGVLNSPTHFDRLVGRHLSQRPCCIIRVGHIENKLLDPIYPWFRANRRNKDWIGVFIEANRDAFCRMKERYARFSRSKFILADISGRAQQNSDAGPVPSTDFSSALDEGGLQYFDLLHVDATGLDWEILRQLDLDIWRPRLILYEHKNMTPEIEAACKIFFLRGGYNVLDDGLRTLATLDE